MRIRDVRHGTKSQVMAAFAAACLFFIQPPPRRSPENNLQAGKGRTLEVQLKELSALISKSSGIEQHFEYSVDKDGWVTIINDKPEDYVHIFRLTNSGELRVELRELRGVQFLADYAVEGPHIVRLPNPINDLNRYALVALSWTLSGSGWQGPTSMGDLTSLASVADEPLELNGYMQHDQKGKLISPKGGRANYDRLRYLMMNRASLRNQDGSLRFDIVQDASRPFLYIVDHWPNVQISYSELSPCNPVLAEQLTKRVSRQELLSRSTKSPLYLTMTPPPTDAGCRESILCSADVDMSILFSSNKLSATKTAAGGWTGKVTQSQSRSRVA